MISVCAGVILQSGKILLCRRGARTRHSGLWEFPGGRIEPGETPETALRRELQEELGIEAQIGLELARTRHSYDYGEIELIALIVSKFTGQIRLTDHDQSAWVESRRILDFDLVPADIPIARIVAQHRRRQRYDGTHPRRFEEKYKELNADPDAMTKAAARGSTPAGAHRPVMLEHVTAALEPLEGATILDCTVGWGGHTEALARRAGPRGRLIGIDRDNEELERTKKRLAGLGINLQAKQGNYSQAMDILREFKVSGVDAVLADLGVSSMQLDRSDRGMSFKTDGPLDMRMDRERGITAAQWLAKSSKEEIADSLSRLGDEPDADKIASVIKTAIADGRAPATTFQLVSLIGIAKGLGPGPFKKKDAFTHHPAARTFQALRIAINDERRSLDFFLRDLPQLLRPGGRAAIITFHPGEEQLVKAALLKQSRAGFWRTEPEEPKRSSVDEVRQNPRARSARLWTVTRTKSI